MYCFFLGHPVGTIGSIASSDTTGSIGNFIGSSGTIFGFHVTS